jgi:hypothetical protein
MLGFGASPIAQQDFRFQQSLVADRLSSWQGTALTMTRRLA